MLLSAELQLTVLILALYVQDALLLLHSNEGVLTQAGKSRWLLGLGATQTRLRGKHLYMPNLLLPHRPHYRLAWDFEQPPSPRKAAAAMPGWVPRPEAFRALGRVCLLSGVLQLLAFPAVMFWYQTDVSVLTVLAAIYASILAAVALVWRKTELFGLSGRKWVALAFECLVCPPFAINLVRRLSLDQCKSADLVAVAEKILTPQAWAAARRQLASRLEDQMSLEPEDSQRHAALQSRLQTLSLARSVDYEH